MVIEIMGHKAGWLALYSGVAGGGDIILIPEIPYSIDNIVNHLFTRQSQGKQFSIVAVAEGAMTAEEAAMSKEERKEFLKTRTHSVAYEVAAQIEQKSGLESRVTVLGYQQRGGIPSAYDRILATQFGTTAAELMAQGEYGEMVAMNGNRIGTLPLKDVAGKLKTVPADHPMIQAARGVGTCFGDG